MFPSRFHGISCCSFFFLIFLKTKSIKKPTPRVTWAFFFEEKEWLLPVKIVKTEGNRLLIAVIWLFPVIFTGKTILLGVFELVKYFLCGFQPGTKYIFVLRLFLFYQEKTSLDKEKEFKRLFFRKIFSLTSLYWFFLGPRLNSDLFANGVNLNRRTIDAWHWVQPCSLLNAVVLYHWCPGWDGCVSLNPRFYAKIWTRCLALIVLRRLTLFAKERRIAFSKTLEMVLTCVTIGFDAV